VQPARILRFEQRVQSSIYIVIRLLLDSHDATAARYATLRDSRNVVEISLKLLPASAFTIIFSSAITAGSLREQKHRRPPGFPMASAYALHQDEWCSPPTQTYSSLESRNRTIDRQFQYGVRDSTDW
jgi:hypothetical protein